MAKAAKRAAPKRTTHVSFDCPEAERKISRAIARRARDLLLTYGVDRPALDIDMDIVATHCNGTPLRLDDLLAADDFNLMHDVSKIARHLNRATGKLEDFFRPRFSKPALAKSTAGGSL